MGMVIPAGLMSMRLLELHSARISRGGKYLKNHKALPESLWKQIRNALMRFMRVVII